MTITVHDALGRRVRTQVNEDQMPGSYRVRWNGRAGAGQAVASGPYFYRLRMGEAVSSKQAFRLR